MNRFNYLLILFFCLPFVTSAQAIDTLVMQDFELSPATPTWTYTGTPSDFQTGFTTGTQEPANSPLGIGGSRAWHVRTVSGGNPLTFANQTIPSGYDTVRVRFNLAAMNLNGTGGGPDNLDYVLVEYSLNNGSTFTNRLRVRGSTANNCVWAYSATGFAGLYYLPTTEVTFQPSTSGLQTTFGYSTVEISFPGSISQLSLRITPRSSSSSDSWLIDNLVLIGEGGCSPSSDSIAVATCDSYTAPSGAVYTSTNVYQDTIVNSTGCDSIVTIDLTVNASATDTLVVTSCDSYLSPGGNTYTTSGVYVDSLLTADGCDSLITVDLTINPTTTDTLVATGCNSYLSPAGNSYNLTGIYVDSLSNAQGCDSLLTIDLTITNVDTNVSQAGIVLTAQATGATYQWINCDNGQAIPGGTSQSFQPGVNGAYAVVVTANNCSDTSGCRTITVVGLENSLASQVRCWPNPVQDQFNLEVNAGVSLVKVKMVDLQGRILYRGTHDGTEVITISTSDLAHGTYFVEVQVDDRVERIKFVK